MNDMERILENMPELPPEDIVEGVSPCRKALNRILTGFALCAVTLNFFYLNYILPAIGILLILLGTRALRKENAWFKGCFVLSCIRTVLFSVSLIFDTTVFFRNSDSAFVAVSIISLLILLVCFKNGLTQLQKKAGIDTGTGGATALIIWYLIVILLALVQYRGFIIATGMLVCYGFIIKNLWSISRALDEAGYAVEVFPLKLSDKFLTLSIALLIIVGAFIGYTFGSNYRMNWEPHKFSDSEEVSEIKTQLESLGFPKDILADLSDEDILACKGALSVVVDITDFPANDGREVTEYRDNGFYTTTVYDEKELRITGIAVRLSGEREQWKVFHHFKWTLPHNKTGTECIQLWPAYRQGAGWVRAGDVSGRVLCDIEGTAYSSDYYYLGSKIYTSNNIIFGSQTSTDIFAEYSMNKKGENHRGYLSYTTAETIDGYILDSWVNYTHQKTWLQFPAKTAMEYRITNSFGIGGAFITVQDALQMHDGELI